MTSLPRGKWVHAYAKRAGPGKRCADWAGCRVVDDTLYVAVADGAGSAPSSYLGSMVTVTTFLAAAPQRLFSEGPRAVLKAIQDVLLLTAKDQAVKQTVGPGGASLPDTPRVEDLACTLVAAAIGPTSAQFLQVGDGAAVFRLDGDFETAIMPDQGEFLNSTYFVTQPNAHEHLLVREVEGTVEEVALFTDGIQGLVLHPMDHNPHEAFFRTVFKNLRADEGTDEVAEAWLASMLGSEMVTNRTDDDTSIVIARRG